MRREPRSSLQVWGGWAVPAGLMLVVAGFIVGDVRAGALPDVDRIAFGLMIGGLTLAAAGALVNVRTLLNLVRGRRALEGVHFAVVVALFLTLAGLLCYISTRWFARMDWTGTRTYSLHSKTRNILSGLDRPIEAVVVIEPTPDARTQGAVDMVLDLLDEFRSASKHVQVRRLDWTSPEGQVQLHDLVQRMDGEEPPRFCAVFLTEDSREVVPFYEIFTHTGTEFTGEDAFAAAIARLVEDERPAVCFLTGHGERPFEVENPDPMSPLPAARTDRSLSRLARALRGDNYEVSALNLAAEGAVPDDCAVLVIAGPAAPIPEAEMQAIRAYLDERHGRAVVLVDPVAVSIGESNINELIGPYGLHARTDAVGITKYDTPLGTFQQREVLVTAQGLGKHPITAGLEQYNFSPVYACPIEVGEPDRPGSGTPIRLLTGAGSWGETDYRPDSREPAEYDAARDVPPPLTVAALVAPREPPSHPMMPQLEPAPGPRLLVIGSSLSFTDAALEQNPAHRYFLMNALNWMGGKLHMLGIPPKTFDMSQATLTAAQMRAGRYFFIAILPAAIIAVGISVWIVRRKRR